MASIRQIKTDQTELTFLSMEQVRELLIQCQSSMNILRHTFARHYMMGGADILGLQRILGHATIAMTMRYAHMSPDHLESALRLSLLAQLGHREVLRRSSGYSVRLVGIKSA